MPLVNTSGLHGQPQEISTEAQGYLNQLATGQIQWTDIPNAIQLEIAKAAGVTGQDNPKDAGDKLTTFINETSNGPRGGGGSGGTGPGGGPGGIPDFAGAGASQQTADDYLNAAASAGLKITPKIKALAKEAANKQWASWQWDEALRKQTNQGGTQGQTADDYLNAASSAGLTITPEIRDLAKEAAQKNWADWQFQQALQKTSGYQQIAGDQFLSSLPAGVPVTPELRQLAEKAASQNWTPEQFQEALLKSDTYLRRQSISYKALLQQYGMESSNGNIQKLIENAVQKGYSTDEFLFFLRKTPEYQHNFPGIFDKNGDLKMSEAAYLAQKQQYLDTAQVAGVKLSDKMTGYLFKHDISVGLAQQRFQAEATLKQNPEMFQQFGRALMQEGVAGANDITRQSLQKFILGEGPQEWTRVWNLSNTRYGATQAGLTIKKGAQSYLNLNPNEIEALSKKGLSPEALSSGFQSVAQQLLTTLPLSKISKMGLTKNQIVEAQFGGPKQAEVLQKMQQILGNEQAFQEGQMATPGSAPASRASQGYASSSLPQES